MTECIQNKFEFQALGSRNVVADFQGGTLSSDAGGLLLGEVERQRGWIRDFAKCFDDHRNAKLIEHTIEELCAQRVIGQSLGYEDLNDHDLLRADPLLAVVCGKTDPTGQYRRKPEDKGKPLAGKSTLNRLEHGKGPESRYKKIVCNHEKVEDLFISKFISRRTSKPTCVILDMDHTDDPLHGEQEGKFFHGYYKCYCYMPLYIFCGSEPLCAKLRPSSNNDGNDTLDEVKRIVGRLRAQWPEMQIILRADSAFTNEAIMAWCEQNSVDYVFGLRRNNRLEQMLKPAMDAARCWHKLTGKPSRCFMEFKYSTLKSWSRKRRVVGKAEALDKGDNPRFVVTSLSASAHGAAELYEEVYCARGDMENRIKEQQLDLFADRTSTAMMAANQIRLWIATIAYCMLNDLRELGLKATRLAKAQCGTIRLRLLKIGAGISISVRRIHIRMPKACPFQDLFATALNNLRNIYSGAT